MTRNAITWFEIPVADIERAQHFYETLLAKSLRREQMGPHALAIFPYEDGKGVGGTLKQGAPAPVPGTDGSLIYLDASPSLELVMSRAAELGAKVLQPALQLPGTIGFIAQIVDSEGNRVGLHSAAA